MSNKSINYSLYEGSFLTNAPVLERSVNILMFRDPNGNEYNILINRAQLETDQTPEEFCEKQMDILRNELPAFQVEGKMLKHEIGPAQLTVVQVANSFLQDDSKLRQVQSIMQLPWDQSNNPNKQAILIFTLSAKAEFTEYQRKHYVQVINSFTPNLSSDNLPG
jgi:hypothetical protein